jgi:hypothetical protein
LNRIITHGKREDFHRISMGNLESTGIVVGVSLFVIGFFHLTTA